MWMMMECSNNEYHGGEQLKSSPTDPMIGRKLRPLMPRPMSGGCSSPYSTTSSCCCCMPNPNKLLSWNHSINVAGDHYCGGGGVIKREISAPLVSTRWNPTAEQLQALEEMYRRGIRTPSAEQIQQIAAKLGRFGKIEGKNVFYWFQNHKARERQKKRRQLELLSGKKINTKQTTAGVSRRYVEIEHPHKKAPMPSNCSTASEDSASMHAAAIAPEKDGWPRFHHNELHHNFATAENPSCFPLPLPLPLPLPPNNSSTIAITPHKPTGQETTNSYASLNLITMLPFILPRHNNDNNNNDNNDNEAKENQILQLFPTASNAYTTTARTCDEETRDSTLSIGTKIRPNHFIEFLPIKK